MPAVESRRLGSKAWTWSALLDQREAARGALALRATRAPATGLERVAHLLGHSFPLRFGQHFLHSVQRMRDVEPRALDVGLHLLEDASLILGLHAIQFVAKLLATLCELQLHVCRNLL